jgi:hypothetical protein
MDHNEAKALRERLKVADALIANGIWLADLIAMLKDDSTTLSVWDALDQSKNKNINCNERANILRDLKDAMICVLEQRRVETHQQWERT